MEQNEFNGKWIRNILIPLFISLLIFGCGSGVKQLGESSEYSYPINPEHIKANLSFLASDALEGREATTHAEKVAAVYISTELQKYGVLPFGDDSSTYFQRVDLKLERFDSNSRIILIASNNDTLTVFRSDSDFVGSTRYFDDFDTTTNLVFAGYGITAAEYNYDDYRNLDVKGKIVLFLNGEPVSDDSAFFAGNQRTRYSSWSRKVERARELGAAGIMMPSWSERRLGWQSAVDYVKKGSLSLLDSDQNDNPARRRVPMVSLRERTLEKLFSYTSYSYSDINRLAEKGSELPTFQFNMSVSAHLGFAPSDTLPAWNLLGIVPGNDPALRDEYIVVGAHYDHLGMNDSGIYNGADDNGSGTVGVMEIARAIGFNRNNARSVIFAFHTCEEKGLLGSKFLVKHFHHPEKIMAHVNFDMIGRGSVDSIYSVGSGRISSELHDLVEQIDDRSVKLKFNYQFDDPNDPERIYYRSDHYSYAKEGIPSVFFYDNMQEDYHKMTDTVDKINFTKIARVVELGYRITLALANLPHELNRDQLAKEQ
jgi:hypothetical protein